MKKFSKCLRLIMVSLIVLMLFSWTQKKITLATNDEYDFANNEDHYYELCSGSNLSDDEKEVCRAFREYLTDKQNALEQELSDLQNNIDALKADIRNQGLKIKAYNDEIDALDVQITSISNSISRIETNIEIIGQQIVEREEKIAQLDKQIKESMVVTQSQLRTNSYIKFIMGADSFVDLLRRISAINSITSYNHKKIDEMEREKALLQADREEQQAQKDNLIVQQADLRKKQETLQKLKDLTQQLIDEFHEQEAELIRQFDEIKEDTSALDEAIKNIDKALENFHGSSGFGRFVKNKRIHINSGCYYYQTTSGGFHAAIDVGNLGFTTPLYAIANGYVFAVGRGCQYNGGYAGNSCNGGRGNYAFIIVEIDDKYYTVYYEHLTEVKVNVGDLVYKEDTVIGISGNSGNSTGPHLHFAIYYQGKTSETSIQEIANLYRRYGIRFGLKYNITGSCPYRNGKAPCYLNPMEIYGFYYPNWYYVN